MPSIRSSPVRDKAHPPKFSFLQPRGLCLHEERGPAGLPHPRPNSHAARRGRGHRRPPPGLLRAARPRKVRPGSGTRAGPKGAEPSHSPPRAAPGPPREGRLPDAGRGAPVSATARAGKVSAHRVGRTGGRRGGCTRSPGRCRRPNPGPGPCRTDSAPPAPALSRETRPM